MLLLFDIDSTLTDTSGAGIKSLRDAGRELFGAAFSTDGVEFSGRLDPLIIGDLLAVNGVADTPDHRADMRRGYARHLGSYLAQPGTTRALPGVPALLDAVAAIARAVPALLTGNFEQTGTMKLRACGIDPARFRFGVWGDQAPRVPLRREDLVPVAFERCRGMRLGEPVAREAVVIGDTPHDVSAAREHGLRCLAVATGKFTAKQLSDAGADRTVATLENTSEIVAWLASP